MNFLYFKHKFKLKNQTEYKYERFRFDKSSIRTKNAVDTSLFYLNVEKCKIKKTKTPTKLKKIQKQIKRRREMNKKVIRASKKKNLCLFLAEVKIGGWKDLNSIKFKRPFLGTKTYIYCESIILSFII